MEWIVAGLVAWLMVTANSATALACLAVASAVLVLGRTGLTNNPTVLVVVVLIAGVGIIAVDSLFGLFSIVITALGRRSDLTTRVPMWEHVLATAQGSPAFGVGFEAYWVTAAGRATSDVWGISNAHNGYLDTYLSSGYIGLGLILLSVASGIVEAARHPPEDIAGAALRLAAIVAVILHNWTESSFRTVSTVWMVFLVAGMAIRTSVVPATESASPAGPVQETGPISIHAWRRLKQGDGVGVKPALRQKPPSSAAFRSGRVNGTPRDKRQRRADRPREEQVAWVAHFAFCAARLSTSPACAVHIVHVRRLSAIGTAYRRRHPRAPQRAGYLFRVSEDDRPR